MTNDQFCLGVKIQLTNLASQNLSQLLDFFCSQTTEFLDCNSPLK